ncbi:MAG: aminobutyraldehyde dehydrogenase [Candidatus Methanoperedens sp.]|nr:aminobutyraldehyde dehydrogenase [Candidatus Methanoperedens sp.]CAG0992911.1 betaine-aldehyde dehydrogenase [Methanosarcinales archaeon]
MVEKYRMFIGGRWVESSSRETFDVRNPATEEVIANVPLGTKEDAKSAIDAARETFDSGAWSNKTPAERSLILWKLAALVEANARKIATLESMNVGKTIKYSRDSDLPFIIDNLRFFAGAARLLEGKSASEYSGLGTSIIRREPIGVVVGVVPWNYPLYIAVWKMAPALAAGNTVVIKPASLTPLTLLEFAKLAQIAGVPDGVLNVVTGPGEVIGEELATSPNVDMISLTGDTSTGKKIMQMASGNLKKVHLELGGKAPFIVLDDANIDAATEGAVVAAFWNSGQDCTAATRVYVHESIHDEFVKLLVEKAQNIRIGDPLDERTDMGPLVSGKQRERIEVYVRSGIEEGANLVHGGKRPENLKKGYFFEPTIFTGVEQKMRICQEEIFGPVLSVSGFSTVDEAVEKANDVIYGLASSVWGKDITDLVRIANRLKYGTVWINEHGVLTSETPHGGFKQSGFGKDLSLYSFEEYTQVKHIYIDQTGSVRKPWYYTVYGEK